MTPTVRHLDLSLLLLRLGVGLVMAMINSSIQHTEAR